MSAKDYEGYVTAASDPFDRPRAVGGRAPDVFRPGAWVPMCQYRDTEEVDFDIVGTGAGGGTLACGLAEQGFSVVALGPGHSGVRWDFASDETEQTKVFWTGDRLIDGENPIKMGINNSGKSVGGSTQWAACPLATVSVPRRLSPPCVYRGFCRIGCSTNAKQSVLTMWIPCAIAAGAEIRDLSMVGRIATNDAGRASGVHFHRDGQWRFQKARNVVVAGYAVEAPRLLLLSENSRYPDGLANSSGLVGKYLMTQSNQSVWGVMDEEVRCYKGPPSCMNCSSIRRINPRFTAFSLQGA